VKRVKTLIKVFDAGNITEAHIVRGMLRAHGIDAYVGGHYLQGGIGELAVEGFASVLVPEEQAASARTLITEYESAGRDDE
jgi:hypothetical protein